MNSFFKKNIIILISIIICAALLAGAVVKLIDVYRSAKNEVTTQPTTWMQGVLPPSINIVDISKAEYSYDEMEADLFALSEQFGELVTVHSAGRSLDNREIYYAVVGADDAPKQLLINAGIHGREYLNPMLVMKQLEHILQYYYIADYNGAPYSELLSQYQIYVVPMVNPDGIMISQQGLSAIRSPELQNRIKDIYESDCSNYSSYNDYGSLENYLKAWKANAAGVDINRNFGIDVWDSISGTIGQPSSQRYKGMTANSEPETQAMISLVESMDRLVGCISYHSQEEKVYWDSGQTGNVRDRAQALKNALCEESGYAAQTSFTSPDGTLDDWCMLNKNIPTVTVETGRGKCPLPLSEFDKIWSCNYRAWLIAADILG